LLIKLKSDIDSKIRNGHTPLNYAINKNHEDCVRMLINAGCSLTSKVGNWTPLDLAKRYGRERVVKLLKKEHVPHLKTNGTSVSEMQRVKTAAMEGSLTDYFDVHDVDCSIVRKLMASQGVAMKMENILQILWFGGDLEYNDSKGGTAVLYVAHYGDFPSLKVLMEYGARIDVVTGNGWGALHLAARWKKDAMVQALINANANVELQNDFQFTALHIAAFKGTKESVALLLQAEADVTSKTEDGYTAAMLLEIWNYIDERQEKLALIKEAEEKAAKLLRNVTVV